VIYKVRLNPRAFNPLTKKVNADRLWEVEQTADRDSEKVVWHCADVRVNGTPIRDLFKLPKDGEPPWEMTASGACTRGQDDVIEIRAGKHDSA
jgi:hypothetical protein